MCSSVPSAESTLHVSDWHSVLRAFHEASVDDQFIPPLIRVDSKLRPQGLIKNGDALVYTDFRTDRAKPLTSAFLNVPFGGIPPSSHHRISSS